MRSSLIRFALLCVLLLTVLLQPAPSIAQPSNDGQPDQVVLSFAGSGPAIASASDYTSPPTAAPRPFTHLLVRREARVPPGARLTLFVRASVDGTAWSDWRVLDDDGDLWMPSDGPDVGWSQVVDVGVTARLWQVRAAFVAAPDGALPQLRRIEVNTVDAARFAPAQAGAPAMADATTASAKPAVVSRTAWGAGDGQGSRVPPDYYPVNHLIVHNTADRSTLYPGEPNWAARVRAIWSFHTFTRGWGDIGYNYLIDPNGVIYEGRAGGDDAVGFHDAANYGSMGVSMIGDYTQVAPSAATQDALIRILAWKAAQKRIDPLGRSYYYGCALRRYCTDYNPGGIVLNIAGHRQVTPGRTIDPGDIVIAKLPEIRNRVKQAIEGTGADNGDLEVDELEPGFTRSNAQWHEAACGAGDHTFYTYATNATSESSNSAAWRPNLPAAGTYRVYAHIPQGCGLASPPYASSQARYAISYAGGSATRVVDHNTATGWVDLGAYAFNAGTGGAVALSDLTGEPYSARRVLFFDAVKWVPESAADAVQLVNVAYERTTVASGELLKVVFTVRNTGDTVLRGQAPQIDPTAAGGLNGPDNGYVYDQDECFIGNAAGSYPAFPKESNRIRVVLGSSGWDQRNAGSCAGATSDYPWRWGLNGDLAPGQQQTVIGYLRFRAPGTDTIQAGVLQEYVRYYAQGASPTTITVTPERVAPDSASYDNLLRPLARVYRLGNIPDNFLARTANPLSIPRGDYVGSFAWDGSTLDWGIGGPLGLADEFIVEQTRAFLAPADGNYTFRTTSDDGSWLWVDGQPVVVNNGLHAASDVTGTITLQAGVHVIAFKYFERTGLASAGYSVVMPGSSDFSLIPDALGGGALRLGGTFIQSPDLSVAADDQGGAGVDRVHWSWDGVLWHESPGGILRLGKLQNGMYRLRYQAIDRTGNQSDMRELAFTVNTDLPVFRRYLPMAGR